jgi:hypothetical protein
MEPIIDEPYSVDDPTPEGRAVKIVREDFSAAKQYLRDFHEECVDRHEHYFAPAIQKNIKKVKTFPVPFTTEQVDQFVADNIEKLWYKDEPCSIYGRNDQDKRDADVKREFMSYQDDSDDIEEKTKQALRNCAICKIAPAVVNYREDYTIAEVEEQVPATDEAGRPIMGMDGMTPITIPEKVKKLVYTYQGATVQLVDPLDFFWTSDKRELYDEFPLMIRVFVTEDWLKQQPFIKQENIKKLREEHATPGYDIEQDLLDERRSNLGFSRNKDNATRKKYEYVEWHGYFDDRQSIVSDQPEKKLYILGVIDGRVCVRMQDAEETFGLGHPNIIVGRIGDEPGEIYGPSIVDKIHSVQHGMDTLFGIWLKSLRQTANPMWVGDGLKLRNKGFENEAGTFVDVMSGAGNLDSVIKRLEMTQISQDIYAGLEMFRQMGQNASGISDIASGVVQKGVETLGEANILEGQASLRMKAGYLRSFEKSFIKPLWEMRNQVNMKYVTDPGYLYAVLEEDAMNWRVATPEQIRANVDFVCEASNRENQRNVVTQQILQLINIVASIPSLAGIPILKLLQKICEDGFNWKQDTIDEIFPVDIIIQQMVAQAQMALGGGVNPQSMPQPKTEGDAVQSANQQFSTPVGEIQ